VVLENSTHTTWGPLKAEIKKNDIAVDRLEAVLRGSRTTLQLDDALLPAGEFTVILVEKEMKSGAKEDEFTKMKLTELKEKAKEVGGIKIAQSKGSLIKALRQNAKAKTPANVKAKDSCNPKCAPKATNGETLSPEEVKEKVGSIIDQAKKSILAMFDQIKATVDTGIDLFAGLEDEAKAIQKQLKK
jgi:hypothetical protein